VHGYRSLTGTIEIDGSCTVLRVGNVRWALLGPMVRALANGDTVTARGTVTNAIPRTCDNPQGLQVTQIRPA
jgi:hypothetical protein